MMPTTTTTIQLTLIRIEGYGPWTMTLGNDREHELQMLQAKLYGDLQMQFSKRKGLVFFNRFDEMFAVTNGISAQEHLEILKLLSTAYDLDVSMSIGRGRTPYEAHLNAHAARGGETLDGKFRVYGSAATTAGDSQDTAQIMHVDVDGSTSDVSLKLSPYRVSSLIMNLYAKLTEAFIPKGALTFFLGGDNFMVVSNGVSRDDADALLSSVTEGMDIRLKCGIGRAKTAREAARLATEALDAVRDMRKTGKAAQVIELSCL
ncbi:MAG: GTP cyclohydrolase IIa [Nitrososphaerales archaeon]